MGKMRSMGWETSLRRRNCGRGSVDVLTIKTSSAGVSAQTCYLLSLESPFVVILAIAIATQSAISRATAQNGASSNNGVSLTNTRQKLIPLFLQNDIIPSRCRHARYLIACFSLVNVACDSEGHESSSLDRYIIRDRSAS